MQEKRKFYQQSWFIMLMLFSPLFPLGMFLMWKEKGMNIIFKIIFTAVYVYAIVFTIQTQDVLFTNTNEGQKVESKVEEKNGQPKKLSESEQKDITTMVSFVDNHEDELGEFYKAEAVETFNTEIYDSVYTVHSSIGKYVFYLNEQKVTLVTKENNQEVKGLSY